MLKILIFDYDNTLAKPKSPPTREMLVLFETLLKSYKIAIVTAGRSIKGLKELLVSNISDKSLLNNLFLCTKYGNTIFAWNTDWYVIHESPNISSKERSKIEESIHNIPWNKYTGKPDLQQKLHDKGSVISINCLGNKATDKEKGSWDRDQKIRVSIKGDLFNMLGDRYEYFITGRNTIDIVPTGTNKGNNILKLLEMVEIPLENAVYIGDEFNPNGNDYPILSLGIEVHSVSNPLETEDLLKQYL